MAKKEKTIERFHRQCKAREKKELDLYIALAILRRGK